MRERHLRGVQRPRLYAALVIAAFLVAAGGVTALWSAETGGSAAGQP